MACTSEPVEVVAVDTAPPECADGRETCDGNGTCWVRFCDGLFLMGSEDVEELEAPPHNVVVSEFELSRHEMTAEQHRVCALEGACELWPEGELSGRCNQEDPTARLPANCLTWDMAGDLCSWAGGRLPSEAEWEYAARSGLDNTYPWGEEEPTCDHAVFRDGEGCGRQTEPVCSRPQGFTDQGVCDMSGNVFEWVEDWMHDGYQGAPDDGSAWVDGGSQLYRVMRGGGIGSDEDLSTRNRTFHGPEFFYGGMGVRCARDVP